MSVQSVSLSNVSVGARPTHIVIYQDDSVPAPAAVPVAPSNVNLEFLYAKIEELQKRIVELEAVAERNTPKPSPFFGATVSGPVGIEVRRLSEVSEEPLPVTSIFNTLITKETIGPLPGNLNDSTIGPLPGNLVEAEELVSEKAEEGEAEEEEAEEEGEEGEAEEGEAEEGEAEEEEEAMELEEFVYKDKTYYRDGDNQVYEKDEDGDLNDTPIGVWNEVKQKVLRYK